MTPSERIDQLIANLDDWRGRTLAGLRKSILGADKQIVEEWKWMGSPVWSRGGRQDGGGIWTDEACSRCKARFR